MHLHRLALVLVLQPEGLVFDDLAPVSSNKTRQAEKKKSNRRREGLPLSVNSVTCLSAFHACSSAQELATEQESSYYCPMPLYVTRQQTIAKRSAIVRYRHQPALQNIAVEEKAPHLHVTSLSTAVSTPSEKNTYRKSPHLFALAQKLHDTLLILYQPHVKNHFNQEGMALLYIRCHAVVHTKKQQSMLE